MKKQYFWVILVFLCALYSCTPSTNPIIDVIIPKLDATVRITNSVPVSQNYIYIYYELINTGNVNIDCYTVYFMAYCTDNSTITDYTVGFNVPPNTSRADYAVFFTAGKTARAVTVYQIYLRNWEQDLTTVK